MAGAIRRLWLTQIWHSILARLFRISYKSVRDMLLGISERGDLLNLLVTCPKGFDDLE